MTLLAAAYLEAQQAGYTYPWAAGPALSGVTAAFPRGRLTALLGPNGSGKSTLLRLLAGVARPSAGEVLLDGRPPAARPRVEVARAAAFLPAQPRVPEDYTSREVVVMGRHPFGRGLLLEAEADLARADAALARVDALAFRDRPCADLSSGERQRVLVARALCQDAPALLLDEPTSAQDPAHALLLFGLFAALAGEGKAVVVATHDLNAAARFAHHLHLFAAGREVAAGPATDVLRPEVLRAVFGVEVVVGRAADAPYAVATGPARGGGAGDGAPP